MFNMVGEDPPLVMISINRVHDGRLKDTAANILHNGEFVVHLSDEPMAQRCTRAVEASHRTSANSMLSGCHLFHRGA
jgi:flavin reductase (DIM6/NTAB) family NADH-FMN oxidoreductase RutF